LKLNNYKQNYQIIIEYDGSKFVGWQMQKNGKSIQGEIQKVIKKVFGMSFRENIIGSGRTDAGVHALGQSANFYIYNGINPSRKKQLLNRWNYLLAKKGISILSIRTRNKDFNARRSAKERTYLYKIMNRVSSLTLDKKRVWHVRKKLNLEEMKKGAKLLTGTHDFSTYRSSSCTAKSPIRTIKKIAIKKNRNGKILIRFVSKSFLQKQVRSMVGCLKFLGEGKWDILKFKKSLISKKRSTCAPPAPACGLYLEKVKY
tara:strand:+ start:97 stop:870 length:774 start_codon:yes stop_codon:yes gene_type:complete